MSSSTVTRTPNQGDPNQNIPDWGAASQKGTRKTANEDAYAFFTLKWGKEKKTATVMIVADGISSTKGGGWASQIAVETIKDALSEPSGGAETTSDRMAEALAMANQEILLRAQQNPQWNRMGTTIVLALIVDARLYVMGLGDSRAYLIRKNKIHRLTTDHTWAQYTRAAQYQNAGSSTSFTDEPPSHSPLVRYLGNPNGVHIDRGVLAPESKEKEEYISVQSGDTVLLCSDGLYKLIPDSELKRTIAGQSDSPNSLVSSLISLAKQKGETDDITAILLKLPEASNKVSVVDAAEKRRDDRPSARTLRFVLAALVALLLLGFQFGFPGSEEGNGAVNQLVAPSATEAFRLNVDTQAPPTQTPTATATLQPNASTEPNSTIPPAPTLLPPTRILPTAALPTPTSAGSSN